MTEDSTTGDSSTGVSSTGVSSTKDPAEGSTADGSATDDSVAAQAVKPAVIVLVGPPASGKSSIGALLAAGLGLPFADTDDLVALDAGKSVGDIFVEDGEAAFRSRERAAAARGLEGFGPGGGVLALGSGAVLDPDVRRMINRHQVIYLEAGFATVAARTGFDKPRVVIPGNPRGRLRALLEERRPVYESLAALTVATDDLAAEEVAAGLISRLRAEGI